MILVTSADLVQVLLAGIVSGIAFGLLIALPLYNVRVVRARSTP
jgi:hypothetical protein